MLDPPAPRSLWWLRRYVESRPVNGGGGKQEPIAEFSRGFRQVYRARELWGQNAVQKLSWLTRSLRRKAALPGAPQDAPLESAAGAFLWATAGYLPEAYLGRSVVICCDSVMGSGRSRIHQWSKYLQNTEGYALDCKHLELVTTRSPEVAAIISDELPFRCSAFRMARSAFVPTAQCPGTSAMSRQ
jgi:hypothetical protein